MVTVSGSRHVRAMAGVFALALVTGCLGGGTQESVRTLTPPPTRTVSASPSDGSSPARSFVVDGRRVLLHVPAMTPATGRRSLIVVLHGYSGQAAGMMDYFHLRALADERGFVLAAPQGTVDAAGQTFWNASQTCCNFNRSTVDDSTFLSRAIAAAVAEHAIDPGRVFIVGHSNGGFMALRLACDHAGQVAAVASLAGAMDADVNCEPSEPVSVLQVHGDADDVIRYAGGGINGRGYTSAAGTVAWWRDADGCPDAGGSGSPLDADAVVPGDDLTPVTWTGCRGDASVALWTIAGGRHAPVLTPSFTGALLDWLEANARRA